MNTLVILQPSYLPWLGYFDQIARADTFVFYDDVQYTRRDWRNRNKIKNSSSQEQLLTIPVETKGRYNAPINEIPIKENTPWREEHLKAIQFNYSKSPHFKKYFPILQEIISTPSSNLADYTIKTTIALTELLGIETKFLRSSEIDITYSDPTDHLIQICKKLEATNYLTGAAAQNYLDESAFSKHCVTLEYQNYDHPQYTQLWPEFISHLSIVDLILNEGPNSLKILSQNN